MLYKQQFDLLKTAFAQNRLSHAYLLSGAAGLGKTNFARAFSELLLCENIRSTGGSQCEKPCGHCRGCLLMRANNHPDFMLIQPEEKKHSIKIDQVREFSEKITRTAQQSDYQVVIISPADAMPVQAANALLKTLEEPAGKVVIFLVDNQRGILPATIASRCQKIVFHDDDVSVIKNNQELRDELLMRVSMIVLRREDSVRAAANFLKKPIEIVMDLLLSFSADISRVQLGADKKFILNCDCCEKIEALASALTSEKLQCITEKLFEKKALIAKGINLNQQLCLEDVFISYEQ